MKRQKEKRKATLIEALSAVLVLLVIFFFGSLADLSAPANSVLIAVGFLLGAWMFSGTIPMFIYYGVQLVSAKWILVSAFILCAIFSTKLSLILIEHIEAHGQGDIDVELLIAHLFTEQKLFDLADSITDGVVMTLE